MTPCGERWRPAAAPRLLDDPPVLQPIEIIGEAEDPLIMGNHDCRSVLLCRQPPQQFHHVMAAGCVQGGCRLIGQNQVGIIGQCPSKRHALTLAGAKVMGVSVRLVCQTDGLQKTQRPPADDLRRHPASTSGTPIFSQAVSPRIKWNC